MAMPVVQGDIDQEDRQLGETAVALPHVANVRHAVARHAWRRSHVQAQAHQALVDVANRSER